MTSEDNPSEYWAGFHDDVSNLDILLCVKYIAKEKGVSLFPSIELTEEGEKRVNSSIYDLGHLGYKIAKALPTLANLEESELYDRVLREYSPRNSEVVG